MPTLGFRVAIRTAADDADEVVLTSVPGGDNPYLIEPPKVDGASADLVEGTCDVGSGTVTFWDELTGVTLPGVVYAEDFEGYADLAALDAAWPSNGSAFPDGTTTWSVATTDAPAGAQAMGLTLTAAGGAAADVLRTHTVSGLTPGVAYTVTARVRVTGTLPNSVHVVLGAGHGTGWLDALAAATSGVQTLTVTQTASIGGGLLLRLGVLSDYGAVTTADLRFDRVRVTGPATTTATGRVMTARLYDLVDDLPRLATLSRKCRIEQTTDGGGSWRPYHRGYLNRAEIDGGAVTLTVGDTTRREQQTELFGALPTLDPASVGLPIPAPRVGQILGGPVVADPTYGEFAGLHDFGPTRWKVEQTLTDPDGHYRVVRLKFLHGYLRPWYAYDRTKFEQDEWEKVNNAARPYFVWDPQAYITPPSATVNHFGYFPNLRARLTTGGTTVERMPIARPVKHESGDKTKPKAEFSAITGNDSVIYVDWGDAPYPSIGTQYDVTLASPVLSDDNPLLLAGHPVDVVAYAAALADVPISAASRAAVKAAIGDGHWCELAIGGVQKFAEFQKTMGGVYGFLLRPNAATGEREFVATRVRPPAPQFAITDADRVSASEDGDGQPLVFAHEEDSVVNVVTFTETRFRRFVYKTDDGDPPVHMLATATGTVEGTRGDTTVNGERTVRFTLPGQMMIRALDGSVAPLPLETADPDAPGYAQAAGGVIVDFAGWGVAETQVLVDAESDAASAQVGDEGTILLGDLPIPDAAATPITARDIDRPGAPRVVRVKKIDPQIGAFLLTLVHAGALSQDAVAAPEAGGSVVTGDPTLPEIAVAPSVAAPSTVATVTITNGADLADDNLRTELESRVSPPSPGPDDAGTAFGPVTVYPDGDATTIDTPAVAPGSTVCVRARSVDPFSGRQSAWTTWTCVALDAETASATLAAPALTYSIDATTGLVTVTASHATAAEVRAAGGSALPSDATVRASAAEAAPEPFVFADLFALAAGATGYVKAFAYDATGNESPPGLLTIVRPAAATDPGDAIGGSSTPYSRPILADAGRRRTILRAVPSLAAEVDEGLRFRYDATAVTRVGLQGWVGRLAGETTHLGSAGACLVLGVSADAGSTWAAADGGSVDTGGPVLPLDAAGLQVGASVALSPPFRAPVTFGLFARGGDGATRPWVGNVAVDCYGVEAPPPPVDPDDPCAPAFTDSFETYADLDALDAVWPVSGAGIGGDDTAWALVDDVVDHGVRALRLRLVLLDAAVAADMYRLHVVSGLTPGGSYVVSARARATGAGGSVHARLGAAAATGWLIADVTTPNVWQTLTITRTASPSGTISIRVGVESDYGVAVTRDVWFDRITVTPDCP